MIWGPTLLIFLLIIIHGVFCGQMFKFECLEETCKCGDTVTITCSLTHPPKEINLKYNDSKSLLKSDLLGQEKLTTGDGKISMTWTESTVKITISDVKFSDNCKYKLFVTAKDSAGHYQRPIKVNVQGLCTPKISENTTINELQCEVENQYNASIVWMDENQTIYQETRTEEVEQLNTGFKLRGSIKLTEELREKNICCSVSYTINGESTMKTSCSSISPTAAPYIEPRNPHSVYMILIPIAGVLIAVAYLGTRNMRNIPFRDRSPSQGPLIGQDTSKEEHKALNTSPPLQTV